MLDDVRGGSSVDLEHVEAFNKLPRGRQCKPGPPHQLSLVEQQCYARGHVRMPQVITCKKKTSLATFVEHFEP